jgi:hypothetical protein
MVSEKFIISKDAYITCNKFKAFECLKFISNLIKNLPESGNFIFTRLGAEYIIMNIMDTGLEVKLPADKKKEYKDAVDSDYFGELLKKVFINANTEIQEKIKADLLSVYTYNGQAIDEVTEVFLFRTPQLLFSALLHAIRYNYDDFFIIGER